MDIVKGKWTKNLIIKAWKRCSTLPKQISSRASAAASLKRSKSWSSSTGTTCKQQKNKAKACQIAPVGCFTVYVGPERERFVVRMEFVNHPLFKMLLEDAALEYGYKFDGPILLPCHVDLFCDVLAEMESDDIDENMIGTPSNCSPISFRPARRRNCGSNRGYGGAYRILAPTSSFSSL
ncbi:auxin-responsive protein SAUR71-like [Argentina anserina]|uniref:auxin-responsive protein SAUR71-like n=1 Tax=Argentina anserina TaxID=57926 RepID=UPI002176482C|nr:auxin-responsive protein SAUR71-like [Potentilla anserina]